MTQTAIIRLGFRLVLIVMLTIAACAARADDEPLVVFAASSLASPLEQIASAYTKQTGRQVRLSYASSAVLARQIERGAPAGLFISAHLDWLSHLVTAEAIAEESIVAVAGNRLVLATGSALGDVSGLDLLKNLNEDERLAIGAPDTVPLGIYAREALTALGLWQTVEGKLAEAASARAALALVQTGATPYGVLFASDVKSAELVALAEFPADSHSPVLYRAAPIVHRGYSGPSSEAVMFLGFLTGEPARAIFRDLGFSLPAARPPMPPN